MSVFTFYYIEAALVVVAALGLAVAIAAYAIDCIVKARRWERYVRLFRVHKDPERRALEILALCEAEDTDALISIGMRSARRRGWL